MVVAFEERVDVVMVSKALQNTLKSRFEQVMPTLWPDQVWQVSVYQVDEDIMDNALKVDMVSVEQKLYAYVYVQKWRADPIPCIERITHLLGILRTKISLPHDGVIRVP